MKFQKLFSIVILVLALSIPVLVHAGAGDNPDGPGGDPGVPVDGGLSLLLAAGVGYGVKKVRDSRKKAAEMKNENEVKEK
jgi:hypothetical protein